MNLSIGAQSLRIVLFGRPGAGKSSLLGALAIAVEQDESPWRLIETPLGLAELRRRVEQQAPSPTIAAEQVVRYPVAFLDRRSDEQKTHVVLIDCDGNAAMRLLTAEKYPSADETRGQLAHEISRADAIILVIPAVASPSESPLAEEDFVQLERFLRLLEEDRGGAVQVGGLPVLLALTKCDLLARSGDGSDEWQKRIAQRCDELDQRFQKFRADRLSAGVTVFGRVRLEEATATAIGQPPPAEPGKPFGVLPLFRDVFELAERYRRSQQRSTGRLIQVAMALLLLVAGMVLFGVLGRRLNSPGDAAVIQTAIEQQTRWYQELRDRGLELAQFQDYQPAEGGKVPWASWDREIETLFNQADSRKPAPTDIVPGARRATYQSVLTVEPVRQARAGWEQVAEQVQQRRNLVTALGLLESKSENPALLKIPPPPIFGVAQARDVWTKLITGYPQFRSWSLEGLPGEVSREIAAAAELSARHLILAGQQEILDHFEQLTPDGKETPALWRKLRDWLESPAELQSWRDLTDYLLWLYHPAAEDPVDALTNFLNRPQHPIELQRLVVVFPGSLNLTPAGKLTIYHGQKPEESAPLSFKQLGEARREDGESAVRYTFVPEAGESVTYRIGYRPGDTLWAELPVQTEEKAARMLTWSHCRSQVFQFERLSRPPRLHRIDQPANEGELMNDIRLIVAVGVVPRLPDLIPVVKLSRR
jgi:GTPase SAR1 family protein